MRPRFMSYVENFFLYAFIWVFGGRSIRKQLKGAARYGLSCKRDVKKQTWDIEYYAGTM